MIPIKLAISGFLSYRDPAELDFSKFDLACISGPNGAGKSSLLDAITYALFGQARARGESLINSHRDVSAAQVTFTFNYEGNVYRVQRTTPRDNKSMLEFQIQNKEGKWKALTEHSLRETETRIRETLRLDYETFVNASFFLQGKADQFTQENATDRKRILGNVLGLEIWEQYRQKAAEKRKALDDQIGVLHGRLQEITNELGEEEQRKARLKELQSQLESLSKTRAAQETAVADFRSRAAAVEQQAALVNTLAANAERERTKLTELITRLEERKSEQASFADLLRRAEENETAYTDWRAVREELAKWEEIAGQFREQELKRNKPLKRIDEERTRLETVLDGLQKDKTRIEDDLAEKEKIVNSLKVVEGKIHVIQANMDNRANVEKELGTARKDLADAVGENPLLKDEMDEIVERIELLKSAPGPICPTCGQTLTNDHRELVITQLNTEGKKRGDRYRANKTKQDRMKKRVDELEARLSKLIATDEDLRVQSVQKAELITKFSELEKLEALWLNDGAMRLGELERQLNTEDYAHDELKELAAIDAELKATGYDAAQHDTVRKREQEMRSAEAEQRALEQAQAAPSRWSER
jgi:exonuclease SbcC